MHHLHTAGARRAGETVMRRWFISAVLLALAGSVRAADAPSKKEDPHQKLISESQFPSASACKQCHEQIYREWSYSSHAYASISPVFHKFEQKINDLSQGTIGTFCLRCHATVGTQMGEKRWLPLWERSQVSREGITCITCHRVNEEYGRVNGERRVVPGNIYQPVGSTTTNDKLAEVLSKKDFYKVKTEPSGRGKDIHGGVFKMEQMDQSQFCVSCHQVSVFPGIKLEVVWEQYRASPAAKMGISCQDCHMSIMPGLNAGTSNSPVAIVDGKPIEPNRPHHNHAFAGPGYPIAHPGIFPHNADAAQYSIETWLKFDFRAGWGTDDFEAKVDKGSIKPKFPKEWSDAVDRQEARRIVDENLKRLEEKRELRRQLMESGSKIEGPFLKGTPQAGKSLKFSYKIINTNPGHNMPSGSLGAQPEIWLNVALTGPDGEWVWESGYVDSYGDMCDLHSLDVAAGKMQWDKQLFNLQTKFLTTNVKGTDREMYLPVNFDIDQIPFIRPATQPITVLNHPPFIRMEGHSIPPLGHRFADYAVPAELVSKPGKYKLSVRLRSRAEPLYFMKFIGSTPEMDRSMIEWMLDIHPYTVEFEVQ